MGVEDRTPQHITAAKALVGEHQQRWPASMAPNFRKPSRDDSYRGPRRLLIPKRATRGDEHALAPVAARKLAQCPLVAGQRMGDA
jgi:hypothetical protein